MSDFPQTIEVADLPAYQQRDDVVLLDIRAAKDFAADPLPRALNIPAENLPGEINVLDDEKYYIVLCPHGIAAVSVVQFLRQHDFVAAVLVGGLSALRRGR